MSADTPGAGPALRVASTSLDRCFRTGIPLVPPVLVAMLLVLWGWLTVIGA